MPSKRQGPAFEGRGGFQYSGVSEAPLTCVCGFTAASTAEGKRECRLSGLLRLMPHYCFGRVALTLETAQEGVCACLTCQHSDEISTVKASFAEKDHLHHGLSSEGRRRGQGPEMSQRCSQTPLRGTWHPPKGWEEMLEGADCVFRGLC